MKIKTQDLIGAQLDWAVAKCEGVNGEAFHLYYEPCESGDLDCHGYPEFHYSSVWAQGGPIIEREKLHVTWSPLWKEWVALKPSNAALGVLGPTLLVAAMRAYVTSKLGDEVEIPEELA